MKRRVRLTALARADIKESALWYSDQKAGLADEFLGEIHEGIKRIREHSLAFRTIVNDVRRANVNRFPFGLWFVIERPPASS